MSGFEVPAAVAGAVAQGRRTAQWLHRTPLAQLQRADGRLADEARAMIAATQDLTLMVCSATPARLRECPPDDAEVPSLAAHALGDQLAVMVDQLELVALEWADVGAPGAASVAAQADALAGDLLALRRSPGLAIG